MSGTTLRDTTRQLLCDLNKSKTYKDIAAEVGLSVGWVEAFGQGKSDDPGVTKVERLYVYLTKRQLNLA